MKNLSKEKQSLMQSVMLTLTVSVLAFVGPRSNRRVTIHT